MVADAQVGIRLFDLTPDENSSPQVVGKGIKGEDVNNYDLIFDNRNP